MKWLLLVALAACSSKSAPPPPPAKGSAQPPPPAKPALPRPTMKASPPIDLPDAGITKLRVMPFVSVDGKGSASVEKGSFNVEWTAKPKYDEATVCRVEAYNLAFFSFQDLNDDAKPNEHEALYHPDPFVIDPHVCEVRFADKGKIIARACYTDGALVAGACPAGSFPAPKLPDKMAMDMQGASLSLTNEGGVQVKAMFTAGKALPDDKTTFAIVCDGVKSKPDPGEGFVPLSRLLAGETLFEWQLSFVMDKPFKALPKQCQLTITNKTQLGTFCIHEGSTDAGRCDS